MAHQRHGEPVNARAAVLALGMTLAIPAHGEEPAYEGQFRSVTWMTRELRPGSPGATEPTLPTLQMLSLRGHNVGNTGMYFDGSAFALQQLAADGRSLPRSADLSYGFVGWQRQDGKARVQVGRQLVLSGAPRYTFLDGASGEALLPMDLRAQAYAGTAAFAGFANQFSAPVVGARLAWQPAMRGHLAVALQDVSGSTDATRRTVGADFSARLPAAVQLFGATAYDLLGRGLQEARLDLAVRPKTWLGLYGRGEVRDPLAYLPANSIFAAFAQRTDGLVGGGFDLRTPGALYGSGSYDRFIVADGHIDGYRGQLNAGLRIDEAGRQRAGLSYARLFNGSNGYDQLRAWWRGELTESFTVAADLDGYWFFKPMHGETQSLTATLAVRARPIKGLQVGADGQLWSNPAFTSQALAMLTLTGTDELLRPPPPPPPPKKKSSDDDEDDDKPAPKKADDKATEPKGDKKPEKKGDEDEGRLLRPVAPMRVSRGMP